MTLVERHSRCAALVIVPNKETDTVIAAFTKHSDGMNLPGTVLLRSNVRQYDAIGIIAT